MKIESPHYGSLEVDPAKLISFPAGLPGFEDCKRFSLLEVDSASPVEHPSVGVLQSVDRPEVAFSVAEPDQFSLHYEFALTEDEEQLLRVSKPEDVAVFLILRRDSDAMPIKANLMAPLVINVSQRIGIQKVIARLGCDVTLRPAN